MSSPSIIQTDGIKRCYLTGKWFGDGGEELEKHHVINGSKRDWADKEGLWIWVTPQVHRWLHSKAEGVYTLKMLKIIAQLTYEQTHSRDEWMRTVKKNYVG